MRRLLLVESFGLRLSNQYILVRLIPSCFHFTKMCLCQVSLLSRCSMRYLASVWGGSCTWGHVSFRGLNVMWIDLDPLAFILCEELAGSLSVARITVIIGRGYCGRFW
jgi:hypothetical protein